MTDPQGICDDCEREARGGEAMSAKPYSAEELAAVRDMTLSDWDARMLATVDALQADLATAREMATTRRFDWAIEMQRDLATLRAEYEQAVRALHEMVTLKGLRISDTQGFMLTPAQIQRLDGCDATADAVLSSPSAREILERT